MQGLPATDPKMTIQQLMGASQPPANLLAPQGAAPAASSPLSQWVNQGQQATPQAQQSEITPEMYAGMLQGQFAQPPAAQPQQPANGTSQYSNPMMQYMIYNKAEQSGDYDTMNKIRAANGLDPVEHSWVSQLKNLVTGAPDKSLGTAGELAQLTLPAIMSFLQAKNTNNFLNNNAKNVNNAQAGNLAASRKALGV